MLVVTRDYLGDLRWMGKPDREPPFHRFVVADSRSREMQLHMDTLIVRCTSLANPKSDPGSGSTNAIVLWRTKRPSSARPVFSSSEMKIFGPSGGGFISRCTRLLGTWRTRRLSACECWSIQN